MNRKSLSAAFLLFVYCFPFVFAGDSEGKQARPPEELLFQDIPVVTAAKKAQKKSEAPAAVTVVTEDDIRSSGARTIAEAIQYKTGVNVVGFRSVDIRGVGGNNRILLLLDGRRTNDVFTGGFEDGFERSLQYVERIEVIKGPASALFGTNAFAGIINVITRKGESRPGLDLRISGGNLSTQKYEALWGTNRNGFDAVLSFSAFSDEGSGRFGSEDKTRAYDLFGKLEWKGITLSAGFRPNRRGVPGIEDVLAPTFIRRRDSFGHLRYDRVFGEKWTLFSQFQIQNETVFLEDPTEDFDARDLRIEGEGWINYRFGESDNLTFGAELRRDRTDNVKSLGTEQYRSTNRSIYVENEFRPAARWVLITGLRVDDNSLFGSSVNPRTGVIFKPTESTSMKFFFGKAFRGPDFLSLFTDVRIGSFVIERNPSLQPEKVTGLEAEISHQPADWFQGHLNVYRNSLRDLITATVEGRKFTFGNVGKASADGIEIGANFKIKGELSAFANYTYQRAEDEVSNRPLSQIPRNTFNAGAVFRSPHDFRIGLFGKYAGSRPATDPLTGQAITLDGYFKADLTFSAPIRKNLEFSASVYNLFSTDYERSVTDPQRGIQAVIGLDFHIP